MAFQTRQQHFSRQIITTNRQFLTSTQAAAVSFNNPVQMGSANPFATTVENPWAGINHMFLGSNNMVIQPQANAEIPTAQSGPADRLPNGQRKRSSTDSMTNQAVNCQNVHFPIPDYAPQNLKDDMIELREADRLLCQQSKKIKLQFVEKQNQAVQHLVESARTPILNKLKEMDAEIFNLGNLNMALQEDVKNLFDDNQTLKKHAMTWEIKAMSLCNNLGLALAEVRRLQGLVPQNEAVAAPHEEEEHDVKSYCGSNVSEKNTQANAQVLAVKDGGETAVEKVQTGAAETGEGSGEKRMCMSCGTMKMSVLALPCWHLCFCRVCGSRESSLHGPCPVCETTMTATALI